MIHCTLQNISFQLKFSAAKCQIIVFYSFKSLYVTENVRKIFMGNDDKQADICKLDDGLSDFSYMED